MEMKELKKEGGSSWDPSTLFPFPLSLFAPLYAFLFCFSFCSPFPHPFSFFIFLVSYRPHSLKDALILRDATYMTSFDFSILKSDLNHFFLFGPSTVLPAFLRKVKGKGSIEIRFVRAWSFQGPSCMLKNLIPITVLSFLQHFFFFSTPLIILIQSSLTLPVEPPESAESQLGSLHSVRSKRLIIRSSHPNQINLRSNPQSTIHYERINA